MHSFAKLKVSINYFNIIFNLKNTLVQILKASRRMIIKSFDLQFTEFRELFKLKSVLKLLKLKINNA